MPAASRLQSMVSVYDLKPRFQALLRPAMCVLAGTGLSANGVTVLALLGSVLVGLALSYAGEHHALLLLVPVWLFLRMALNAIDGMMARELDMQSHLGAILNELGDVLSDAALYLPLAFVVPSATWPVILFVLGAVTTEFCGVLAASLGAGRRYDGPMGKSDRAFWIGALALVTFFAPTVLDYWNWVFGVAAAATLLTTRNRIARALTVLKAKND